MAKTTGGPHTQTQTTTPTPGRSKTGHLGPLAVTLRTSQGQFLKVALSPGIDTAALSMPRGNGKTWLAAHILARCLRPGDVLHEPGKEYLLCAASIEQARLCFRFVRSALEPTGEYRFLDASTRLGITHTATNTRLRILSSNGKTAMGIVDCPLLVADEPGSWEVVGGELMNDAIQTAQGKPGSPLKVIYIGTLAPASSGWWHDLIEGGSFGTCYVQSLRGDREKWDSWPEIRRVNPLVAVSPAFRRKLLEERDAAQQDTRLKARFLSYRLNVPSKDDSEMLLTLEDWQQVLDRTVPGRVGPPIVAVDLGGGRAWSAAVAMWQGGRVEALAVAPGIPSVDEQEKRDRQPSGSYQALVDRGVLALADGLRVQPPAALWEAIKERWGIPVRIVCDRFRLAELLDSIHDTLIESRVTRWSDASFDIRSLRALAKDGPLAVDDGSRAIIAASLSVALVKNDDQGSTRLVKRGTNNTARDDVAAALALAAGAYVRAENESKVSSLAYAVI